MVVRAVVSLEAAVFRCEWKVGAVLRWGRLERRRAFETEPISGQRVIAGEEPLKP